MADKTLPELYTDNPVSIDPGDLGYVVENTGTTPAEGAFKLSQLMFNRYKLSVTVSANDLVVALKHEDGTDPSADRPLYFKIGDSLRACTAALSKTLPDGTSWFNSGAAELGTKEIDYFAYAIWNTTPATDILDLGIARAPYFNVYSDASATTTNEKYLAYANGSAPAATDDMVNIGRFAATLSLTGTGHLWTVPTFTTVNLKNRPTFETRWLDYVPTIAGYSANPTNTVYIYQIQGGIMRVSLREVSDGTSNNTAHTYSAPFSAATRTNMSWYTSLPVVINNGTTEAAGSASLASASASIAVTRSALTAWTASGNCRIPSFVLMYEI